MRSQFYIKYYILFLFLIGSHLIAKAWVYPEHRLIFLKSLQQLDAKNTLILKKIWNEVRVGNENRLTEHFFIEKQPAKIFQLDYASWPAIAGDHSCSPQEMLTTILTANWIFDVANVAEELQRNLINAKTINRHNNVLHKSDLQLLRYDEQYLSRAGANNAHFSLPRKLPEVSFDAYILSTISSGAPLNAIGIYQYFHGKALEHAKLYAQNSNNFSVKKSLITAALAEEAFAIHFLQDAFASGHAVGAWGNAATLKGTHDFYNEQGIELQMWNGERKVFMGDAFLDSTNALYVANVVKQSLIQLLEIASTELSNDLNTVNSNNHNHQADSFNVCINQFLPQNILPDKNLKSILVQTGIPGLVNGKGVLPRYRSELGPFFGISANVTGESLSGGFAQNQNYVGTLGSLEVGLRFGVGLDGVLSSSGDGLAFFQFSLKETTASSHKIVNTSNLLNSTALTSVIPARSAYSLRLRMPFYAVPGDLLIASPFLMLFSPKTLNKMAVKAVNGGVIPWQSGINTKVGRFQMVLGREVGITFYGQRKPSDLIIVSQPNNNVSQFVTLQTTYLEFPIVEYVPIRKFSQDQTSRMVIQLFMGLDMPKKAQTIFPENYKTPTLKTVWITGLRFGFNWRKYFQ